MLGDIVSKPISFAFLKHLENFGKLAKPQMICATSNGLIYGFFGGKSFPTPQYAILKVVDNYNCTDYIQDISPVHSFAIEKKDLSAYLKIASPSGNCIAKMYKYNDKIYKYNELTYVTPGVLDVFRVPLVTNSEYAIEIYNSVNEYLKNSTKILENELVSDIDEFKNIMALPAAEGGRYITINGVKIYVIANAISAVKNDKVYLDIYDYSNVGYTVDFKVTSKKKCVHNIYMVMKA